MLDKFKSRSSFEKLKIITNDQAWLDFFSQFNDLNQCDSSELKRIFELYHKSISNDKTVLMDSLTFIQTENNPLQIEILKLLYNAKCILNFFLRFYVFYFLI